MNRYLEAIGKLVITFLSLVPIILLVSIPIGFVVYTLEKIKRKIFKKKRKKRS